MAQEQEEQLEDAQDEEKERVVVRKEVEGIGEEGLDGLRDGLMVFLATAAAGVTAAAIKAAPALAGPLLIRPLPCFTAVFVIFRLLCAVCGKS
jgi:hypothetical protein